MAVTRPAERYGDRTRAGRIRLAIAVGLLAVAGLAWTGWVAWDHATRLPRWSVDGFQVVDERQVTVRVDLLRDPSKRVVCDLLARNRYHEEIGSGRLEVPAGGPASLVVEGTVATSELAVNGDVSACRAE